MKIKDFILSEGIKDKKTPNFYYEFGNFTLVYEPAPDTWNQELYIMDDAEVVASLYPDSGMVTLIDTIYNLGFEDGRIRGENHVQESIKKALGL